MRIVEVETRAAGSVLSEIAHEWLRTVVSRANRNAVAVENRRYIMRMDILDVECDDARLISTGRIASIELHKGQFTQLRQGIAEQIALNRLDAVEANLVQIVNRRN